MRLFLLLILCFFFALAAQADEGFFRVESVEFCRHAPSTGPAVYEQIKDKKGNPVDDKEHVIPFIAVKVSVPEKTLVSTTYIKVYFYSIDGTFIDEADKPNKVNRTHNFAYATPFIYEKNKTEVILFALPEAVRKYSGKWCALAVFGDQKSAGARAYPSTVPVNSLDFLEKELYAERHVDFERKPAIDPVVEQVVETHNPKYPHYTLFLRPPKGVSQGKDVQGVMAICVLAQSVEQIRRCLQGDPELHLSYAVKFADDHKLAIIAWGAHRLWDPGKSWDDMSQAEYAEMDKTLDDMANAWEKGVTVFVKKYGIPDKDYLLDGNCGAGQFASRIALRKPQFFLAVHFHMPGSCDKPTPEGRKILWCLTTGELESGYERTKRFYAECRALGYPMIYKAIVGLGHAWHPGVEKLSVCFFEYALSVKDQRDAWDAQKKESDPDSPSNTPPPEPWLESFRKPPFYGDIVNQGVFPADQVDMIPKGFRVPLPTKEIADAWDVK